MISIPLSSVLGSPLSGWILSRFSGVSGLTGWQWLFLIEGAPAIIVGILLLLRLPDGPESAAWLSPQERSDVEKVLHRTPPGDMGPSLLQTLSDWRVWLMAFMDGCFLLGLYSVTFWFPTAVAGAGVRDPLRIGLLAALVGMLLNGWHSDRTNERRLHVMLPVVAGGALLCACALERPSLTWLVVQTAIGYGLVLSALPPFWSLPSLFLRGHSTAIGLALINSASSLAGFLATFVMGWAIETFKGPSAGMVGFSTFMMAGGVAALLLPRTDTRATSGANPADATLPAPSLETSQCP